jgi:hypothetical protein
MRNVNFDLITFNLSKLELHIFIELTAIFFN